MTAAPFCSRLAAEAAEGVLPGTGVRGEAYVFLPVDKQLWGERELNRRWASPGQIDAIRQARRGGVTTRLYNPSDDAAEHKVLIHRSPSAAAAVGEALGALLSALADKAWPVDEAGAPRLAICTQGTRDRCCAKWGFAVYRQALQLFEAGSSPFAPLECSHLGGDRYAATGIFFPSGGMYGHLDQVDLVALAAAETAGALLPGHYRGRVFEDELTQIVRAGLAADGHVVGATTSIAIANPQDAPGEVRVTAGGAAFVVSLGSVDSAFFGSCQAVEQGRVSRARRLVYAGARAG